MINYRDRIKVIDNDSIHIGMEGTAVNPGFKRGDTVIYEILFDDGTTASLAKDQMKIIPKDINLTIAQQPPEEKAKEQQEFLDKLIIALAPFALSHNTGEREIITTALSLLHLRNESLIK